MDMSDDMAAGIWLGMTLVVTGAICLGTAGCHHATAPVASAAADAPYTLTGEGTLEVRADLVPRLSFSRAELSPIIANVHGVGEVDFQPGSLAALRIPFDGIIETVEVSAGARVMASDVLARVRSSELAKMRADVRRLASELSGQYDALKRTRELVQNDAISNRRLIELQAKIGSLEAERNGMLVALRAARTGDEGEDLFELRCPRSGEVIERHIDPGEQAHDPDNQPAFIIADPQALLVTGNFPERNAPLLREGFACRVEVPALGETPLPGRVASVVHAVDRDRRTVGVTCVLDSVPPGLRAHMLARITIAVEGEPAIVVPRDAVLLRRDDRVVLVRTGPTTLERRLVSTGANVADRIVVTAGLRSGEEVVSEGAVLLDGELDRLL